MSSINCNGKLIDLTHPKVMGILNVTPDSFFDGANYQTKKEILLQTEKMLYEGATFIDVGGYSSRPNAKNVAEKEELERVLPTIKSLVKQFPEILISVDTFRSAVAIQAIKEGACMINDISAGNLDTTMFKTIANLQVPYIIMHMIGTPQTMQTHTQYKNLINDVIYYFSDKICQLKKLRVNDIIIDVGFGFSKTLEQNFELLKNLSLFKQLDCPILTGLSRKSMFYKLLKTTPNNALNATTVGNTIALLNGSNIVRVHDVKEAIESIKIIEKTITV